MTDGGLHDQSFHSAGYPNSAVGPNMTPTMLAGSWIETEASGIRDPHSHAREIYRLRRYHVKGQHVGGYCPNIHLLRVGGFDATGDAAAANFGLLGAPADVGVVVFLSVAANASASCSFSTASMVVSW